jgi:hypothetical protein
MGVKWPRGVQLHSSYIFMQWYLRKDKDNITFPCLRLATCIWDIVQHAKYCHDLWVWLIKGGWVEWLNLPITPLQSLVITINYNKTINLQPNPSSWTAKDLLHSHSLSDLILLCTTYIVSRQTHTKHIHCLALKILYCWLRIFVAGLFAESFASNGSTCHNI